MNRQTSNRLRRMVPWRAMGLHLAFLAAAVAMTLAGGCEEQSGSYAPLSARSRNLRSGRTELGYGRIAHWAMDTDLLRTELRECREAGMGIYTASLLGWWRYAMPGATDEEIRDRTQTAYEVLIDECRSLGLIALIDIHNQNSGGRKYGERGRTLDDPAEVALIDWGIELVRQNGPANVIVIPCREAREENGFAIERKCIERLHGFQLCANAGSRTWPVPGWADFAEWHPWTVHDVPPSGAIVASDTGAILSQLNAGGVFGMGRPETVRQWMQAGVDQGNPARVFYTLFPGPLDAATIQAIGTVDR